MEFADFLKWLAALLSTAGMTTAVIAFLSRTLFKELLERDREVFRSSLSKDFAEFKLRLDATEFEHQTRFSVMQERRADVVAKMYDVVVTAHERIREMASPMQFGGDEGQKKQRKDAADAFNDLYKYFSTNRIYLGRDAAIKADKLVKSLKETFIETDYARGVIPGADGRTDSSAWIKVWEKVNSQVPPLLDELEQSFHKILGIND